MIIVILSLTVNSYGSVYGNRVWDGNSVEYVVGKQLIYRFSNYKFKWTSSGFIGPTMYVLYYKPITDHEYDSLIVYFSNGCYGVFKYPSMRLEKMHLSSNIDIQFEGLVVKTTS
ncbi:MAG: hypothetical protein GY804_08900 [Alphaproteobacteria bacterium]|nr:hypothetical protein [Alphaproteobacteria bacterium]